MTPNIVYLNGGFLTTPLQDWPEKPEYCHSFTEKYPCDGIGDGRGKRPGYCICHELMEGYQQDITIALATCTPVVSEDTEKVLWYVTKRDNHSDWSWAYQGAKAAIKIAPLKLSGYFWDEKIKELACEELQQGPVRNEYLSVYIRGAETLVDGTLYKDTGIELVEVEEFMGIGYDDWIEWDKELGGTKRIPELYEYRRAFKLKV